MLRALNSFDELYALLSLIVERYYLRTFGGSFTENFYSLKRERVLRTKDGEIPRAQIGAASPVRDALKLHTADVWKNLAVMVGLPYLKRKLDESYDIHIAPHASLIMGAGGGPRYHPSDDLPPHPSIRQRFMYYYKWFLRHIYPSVNAAYYFSILAFNLAYLFDNTKYSSPFLWLIGTRIRRLGPADHRAIAMATQSKPSASNDAARSRPGSSLLGMLSPQNLYPQVLYSLRFFLPASIFALKFLEWWHASDFSRQLTRKATEALDLPAPVVAGMIDPSHKKKAQGNNSKLSSSTSTTATSLKPALATSSSSLSFKRRQHPISSTTLLPIFTVPLPPPPAEGSDHANTCPICLNPFVNPTACQTGYVFCYSCLFRWINGEHDRQTEFMNGEGAGAAWEEDDEYDGSYVDIEGEGSGNGEDHAGTASSSQSPPKQGKNGSDGEGDSPSLGHAKSRNRHGRWESGKGRCPVTGRRVLGGTEGLRRVLV